MISDDEEIYAPLKFPYARMNILAILEVFSQMGLRRGQIDDHLFSDCVNDLPVEFREETNRDGYALLGECLLKKDEAEMMERIRVALIPLLDIDDVATIVVNPAWPRIRRFSRELLRLLTREELSDFVGLEDWEKVRQRGEATLRAFPDPLDYKPLDTF